MERYDRNKSMISEEDQILLSQLKVCIIGCGGLGGYVIEQLARLGVGHLTLVDGDCFDITNLNRQLLATTNNMGEPKVEVAKKRVALINPEVSVTAIYKKVTSENCREVLEGHDVFIDGLDHIDTRRMVVSVCKQLQIPYIYGAIAGWYGMVSTILPEDNTMDMIYRTKASRGEEVKLGNPSFTPALVASLQVSEFLKLVTNKGALTRKGFLYLDLLTNEMTIFNFNK